MSSNTESPCLDEDLSQVGSLQSKDVLLLGVVGRFRCERVLQMNGVGTESRALVAVFVSVQVTMMMMMMITGA